MLTGPKSLTFVIPYLVECPIYLSVYMGYVWLPACYKSRSIDIHKSLVVVVECPFVGVLLTAFVEGVIHTPGTSGIPSNKPTVPGTSI